MTANKENPFDLAETTYRWLNEFATQGIFTTDARLRIASWNRWLAINSGLSREEALGQELLALFPEIGERKLDKQYQAALQGQVAFLSQRLHGYLLPMPPRIRLGAFAQMQQSAHIAPLLDGDEVVGTLTVIEDVTDRLVREMAVKESEARYHSLFEGVPIGLYRTTPDGRIVDVNPAMVQMLGYPDKETLLAQTAVDLYESARTRDEWQSELAHRDEIYRLEVRLRCFDGALIWAEDVARAVRDENGDIIFYDGSLKDITERKEAETALQRRERELASIIAHLPEGVLLLDENHHMVMTNPAANDALPLLLAEESDVLTRLGDKSLSDFDEAAKLPWFEVKSLNGERLFEVTTVPVSGEASDSQMGCILVLRDVTIERQQREYQTAQERLATVGQMAAGIAHDFNNIMATVVLYAQMIGRSEELPNKLRHFTKTIEEQANRAAKLTQQMLDFSRRSVLTRQEVDILPFMKDIYKLLERTLPETINIRLIYDEHKYIVNVDPTRLQQIVMNLALNARDAMPGGGEIKIALSRLVIKDPASAPIQEMTAGEWVIMRMSDTGMGIEPNLLPHIYEPFFTSKSPGKGTGLGLSQVYGIVKQHGGFIDVDSQVNVGTTFLIYLPLQKTQKAAPPPILNALPQGAGELVLVVEDNLPVRLAICEVLNNAGFNTLSASDGREGLEIFDRSNKVIKLVISDLVMPRMSGQKFFAELAIRDPKIKILVITGYSRETEEIQLHQKNLAGWLQKPFTTEQVISAIDKALGNSFV